MLPNFERSLWLSSPHPPSEALSDVVTVSTQSCVNLRKLSLQGKSTNGASYSICKHANTDSCDEAIPRHQGRCEPMQGQDGCRGRQLLCPFKHTETLFLGLPFSLSSHCTIDAPGLRDLVSVLRPGTEKSLRNAKERCFSFKRFVEGGNVSNWDEQFGNQIKAKMDEKWMPQSPWESSRTMHSLLPLSQGRKPCSLKSRSYYFEILQAPQHSAVLFLFFVVLCMVFFRCNKRHFYFWMMFPARYWLEMPWPESLACG